MILLSGSNSSILSKRLSAGLGINANCSLTQRLWNLLGRRVCQRGRFTTLGHTPGTGVPQIFDIISNCIISTLAWNRNNKVRSVNFLHHFVIISFNLTSDLIQQTNNQFEIILKSNCRRRTESRFKNLKISSLKTPKTRSKEIY